MMELAHSLRRPMEVPSQTEAQASGDLTACIELSATLLQSVYELRHGLCGAQYDVVTRLTVTYPEIVSKLQSKFPEHPVLDVKLDKVERDGMIAVQQDAQELMTALQPLYDLLLDVASFQETTERLLADLHQVLMPLTLGAAPLLVRAYMGLLCNACRIMLLMTAVPRKLIVQLYTVAHTTAQQRDPPNRESLVTFLSACDDPAALLQQRFQSITQRVNQVLELVVSPVVGSMGHADVLSDSAVLDVHRAASNQLGVLGMSQEATYSYLQRLHDYQQWALLGFLACPGAAAGMGGRELLRSLLQDTCLLRVYRNVTVPVHPLFEAAVRPALEQLADVRKDAGAGKAVHDSERKEAKGLVEAAWRHAAAGCACEHALRRHMITKRLQDMGGWFQEHPSHLPEQLPMVLAALAYAKHETEWYFDHVGEQLPAPPAQGKLALVSGPGSFSVPQDAGVVVMLAASARMHAQLVQRRSALQLFASECMRASLVQQLIPGTLAIGDALDTTPQLAFAVPTLQAAMEGMGRLCGTIDLYGTGAAVMGEPGAHLAHLSCGWLDMSIQLFSQHGDLRQAQLELPAKDPRYLETVHEMLELWPFVEDFEAALHPCCSLHHLRYHAAKLRQLLGTALANTQPQALHALSACPALLQVLHWVADNGGPSQPSAGCSQAEQQATMLMQDMCSSITLMLAAIAKVQPSLAQLKPQHSQADDGLLLRVCHLAGALCSMGPVRVSGDCVIIPWEHVCLALRQSVQAEMDPVIHHGAEGPPPPSQLAGRLRGLLQAISQMQPALNFDPLPVAWEVLLQQCEAPAAAAVADEAPDAAPRGGKLSDTAPQPPGSNATGTHTSSNTVISVYAAWLVDQVIRDAGGQGAMYAPQRKAFTCVQGQAESLQRHASLAELTALLQMLGPYAAQTLAVAVEAPLSECLGHLDSQLLALQDVLKPIMLVLEDARCCVAAVSTARAQLDSSDAPAVLSTVKLLGRCLALRQLLADAVLGAAVAEFPLLPAVAGAVAASTAAHSSGAPGRHLADVYGLPRPGHGGDGSPCSADPYVVRMLTGNNSMDRYERWCNLPALLGLTLGAAVFAPQPHSDYSPADRALASELHALAFCAKALALAAQDAADKMLSAGGRFLHPRTQMPAQDMLASYARIASAALYNRSDDVPALTSSKQMAVSNVVCDQQYKYSQLLDVWLPPTRLWSAATPPAAPVHAPGRLQNT